MPESNEDAALVEAMLDVWFEAATITGDDASRLSTMRTRMTAVLGVARAHDAPAIATLTASLAEAEARAGRAEAALERLRPYLGALPPGVWETWTACSYRRITARGGADGGVLHAYNQRSDGHPDLSWTERECQAICEIVNAIRAALQETPHGR